MLKTKKMTILKRFVFINNSVKGAMSPKKSIVYLVLCFAVLSTAVAKQSKTGKNLKYEPGVVVVKLKGMSSAAQPINRTAVFSMLQSKYGMTTPQKVFSTSPRSLKKGVEELEKIYTLRVSAPTDIEALAQKLEQEHEVEFAEPNYYFPLTVVPNDPLYSQIYPLSIVKADSAWNVQKGDSTVIIAIIDSGVDWDHPDLASVIWTNSNEIPNNGVDDDSNGYIDDIRGWDFVANVSDAFTGEDGTTEDNNPMDFDGHGTHVAGIAAGATNNGIGIASLSWGCKIMPLRCGWHSSDGNGYVSSLYAAKAYKYAADNGASVVNQSSGTSEVVIEGAKYAYKNGVVITNSAGNSNSEDVGLLGAEPWALSVAATNSNDNKASYSSYGPQVDISAPGGDFSSGNRAGFLSTVVHPSTFYGNQQYAAFQGTSMSSPFVAALAALIKSKNKSWTPAQVMFQITGTADKIDAKNPLFVGKLGYGRINALRAVTETPPAPSPKLEFVSYVIDDASGGNGNGVLEEGESAKLKVIVRNEWGDAQNLTAVLSTTHWAVTVTKANSNYGLLYGISNIDSAQRGSLNDDFTVTVDPNAIPQIVTFTVTFSAAGGYTKEMQFTVALGARLLLVDDDDGIVNVEGYYTDALTKLGTVYDIWDHTKKGTPPLSVLQQYSAVIWLCEWAFPSLNEADRIVISSYLDGGGRLFLSGQDIGWDLADVQGTQYVESSGASKTFFETYLKSKYVSDDAAVSTLAGVPADSIGDGIQLSRYQPNRASNEQYPDVIDTVGGSRYSFTYTSGTYANRGGAIIYNKNYKLLYFAFGGFESITSEPVRLTVMERVLKWLFEYDMVVDKLKNTEQTNTPYTVTATITTKATLQSVDLFWDNDGSFPYKKIPMTLSNGKYTAEIPAQTSSATVEYFVLAKTSKGSLPYLLLKFYVGPDTVKPTLTIIDSLKNTLSINSSTELSVLVSDDIGVDSLSVKIHYKVNSGAEQSITIAKSSGDVYKGKIIPTQPFTSGDVVTYYLTATDISQGKNVGRTPSDGVKQFIVGRELVDDFENIFSNKWDLGLWNYTTKLKYKGSYSMTDSPDSNYKPNTERTLTLKQGYNLEPFTSAMLTYYRRYSIDLSDTVFVEVSNNGTTWYTLKKLNGLTLWQQDKLSLNAFVGTGNANVTFRFRFKTDPTDEMKDGIYIDEVEILTNNFTVGVLSESEHTPNKYSLAQNYPNPFNPVTAVQFTIAQESFTTLKVYDAIGREVAVLVNERKAAGSYKIHFDASQLASGVYYYKLTAGNFSDVKKMVVIK